MMTYTKKRGYFLSLMVSVVVLTLCSTAWSESERLMLFMADSYMLNLALDNTAKAAAIEYLDVKINPILKDEGQAPLKMTPIGRGLVIIHSRDNLRGDDGTPIGSGEDLTALLLLVVLDPAAPGSPGITLLLVESFQSNLDVVNYLVDKGVIYHREPSEVKRTHEIELEEKGTKIKELIDVRDQQGTIRLETKFIAPEPYYEPSVVQDVVSELPYRLRYSYAPEKLFSISILRKIYEPLVEDVRLRLNIDVSGSAGEIFNALDKDHVTKLRFVHQIMVIDEISP